VEATNGVMLQGFHWYSWDGGGHWNYLAALAPDLAAAGVTAIWLPPPYKCDNPARNVGYGPYDLYDLGEYDQKGSVPTKYGTKTQFLGAVAALKRAGLQVYIDAVFNHRAGADGTEEVGAIIVDKNDRTREVGDWRTIGAWTRFDFAGRLNSDLPQPSTKTYSHHDFDAVDRDEITGWSDTVFKLKDKQFETHVSPEKGNDDFLMFADHDMDVGAVVDDLKRWGAWILDATDGDGFRLDALKHIRSFFFRDFLASVRAERERVGREVFAVGEYWETRSTQPLHDFLDDTDHALSLFDVPLQAKFHDASRAAPRSAYDLRQLVTGTLAAQDPVHAVTFVENHDTQPLQALEQVVEAWFKPWAYAFILLRQEGYPCLFHADWTGADYQDRGRDGSGPYPIYLASHEWILRRLLVARHRCAWGEQRDYFDHPNTVGWSRLGDNLHPHSLAVMISNGTQEGWKWMEVGRPGAAFVDLFGHRGERIVANEDGWARFTVNPESCSVWVAEEQLPELNAMLP